MCRPQLWISWLFSPSPRRNRLNSGLNKSCLIFLASGYSNFASCLALLLIRYNKIASWFIKPLQLISPNASQLVFWLSNYNFSPRCLVKMVNPFILRTKCLMKMVNPCQIMSIATWKKITRSGSNHWTVRTNLRKTIPFIIRYPWCFIYISRP